MSDLGSHWIDLPFWALKLEAPATDRGVRPAAAPGDRPGVDARRPTSTAPAATCPPVTLTWYQGDGQARALDEQARSRKWDSGVLFVGDKGMLLADYGKHVLLPEEEFARLQAPRAVHPEVARPPRRVDPRLQDRRADDLQLRVRRLADRGEPPGQRRLPRRQEARVGRRQARRRERPRGRAVHPPRVPQGLDAGLIQPGRASARKSVIRLVLSRLRSNRRCVGSVDWPPSRCSSEPRRSRRPSRPASRRRGAGRACSTARTSTAGRRRSRATTLGDNYGDTFRVEDGVLKVTLRQVQEVRRQVRPPVLQGASSRTTGCGSSTASSASSARAARAGRYRNSGVMFHCQSPESDAQGPGVPGLDRGPVPRRRRQGRRGRPATSARRARTSS